MHSCQYDFSLPNPAFFSWVGQSRFKGTIDPLKETIIDAHAYFYAQGKYDINKWKMSLKMDLNVDKCLKVPPNLITQVPTLPHLISVFSE